MKLAIAQSPQDLLPQCPMSTGPAGGSDSSGEKKENLVRSE